jgi:hypothetical protein
MAFDRIGVVAPICLRSVAPICLRSVAPILVALGRASSALVP